jgi:DNA-binding MarR family transcriptional regulator
MRLNGLAKRTLQLQQEIAAMIDSLEAAGYFQLP